MSLKVFHRSKRSGIICRWITKSEERHVWLTERMTFQKLVINMWFAPVWQSTMLNLIIWWVENSKNIFWLFEACDSMKPPLRLSRKVIIIFLGSSYILCCYFTLIHGLWQPLFPWELFQLTVTAKNVNLTPHSHWEPRCDNAAQSEPIAVFHIFWHENGFQHTNTIHHRVESDDHYPYIPVSGW